MPILHFELIPGDGNDALHEVLLGTLRVLEDDGFSAFGPSRLQHQLVRHDVVTHEESRLHRRRRYLEGFENEHACQEGSDHVEEDARDPIAEDLDARRATKSRRGDKVNVNEGREERAERAEEQDPKARPNPTVSPNQGIATT